MSAKKSIDIKRKSRIKDFDSSFLNSAPKQLKTSKILNKDLLVTILLIVVAFLLASGITQVASDKINDQKQTQPQNKTADEALRFHKTQTTKKKETEKTSKDTQGEQNPFAPFTLDNAKELEKTNDTTNKDQNDAAKVKKQEIAKDSFKVRVLNGNGVTGDASRTKQELAGKGFSVGAIGNAKNRYSTTYIYYLEGKEEEAKLLQSSLPDKTIKLEVGTPSLIGDGYQLLLVLGVK